MDFLHLGDKSVGSGDAKGASGLHSWQYGGVVTIIDFKQTFAGRGMCTVVMHKCSEGEPFRPVSLEVIDKYTEVFFNLLIDSFSLSIGLGMKGGQVLLLT